MITKLLDGRYQITETIETAEWGQTYLAKDTHLPGEPQCFIKHLQPAQFAPELIEVIRQKLQRETQVLEVLAPYEQVPKLLAYFEDNHEFFLVESYSPGHALETEIVTNNPLEEQTVIRLMKDVLEILAYLQTKGVVHGDIRPSNLIRRDIDGKLQLIDFGAAQYFTFPTVTAVNPNYRFDPVQVVNPLSGEEANQATNIDNNVAYSPLSGSLNYLPPPFNSDIYGLGLMLIRALTGLSEEELEKLKVFNNGDQYPQITWRHLAICSVAFGDIIDKMVAVDEQVRYASAVAVQQDLQELENRTITDVYKYETYREEVRRVSSYRGEISVVGREILDELKNNLGLSDQEIENIEDEKIEKIFMDLDFRNRTVLKIASDNEFAPLMASDKVSVLLEEIWVGKNTYECDGNIADFSIINYLANSKIQKVKGKKMSVGELVNRNFKVSIDDQKYWF